MPRDGGQVAGFTAGDLADADPLVRPGERRQFAPQQLGEPLHGRPDGPGDMGGCGLAHVSGSASCTGRSRASAEHRQREVSVELADGVINADGGRGPPVRGLRKVPLAERVEGCTDLRQPAEVAVDSLGAGDGHGRHRLEDQALPADVALRRRVGGPERVLGVGAGSFDQGGEYPVVDALGVGEASCVDLANLAADSRELLRGALACLPARVEGQPVEFGYAEQSGVVRVVAVLGGEIRFAEAREFSSRGTFGAGHVPSFECKIRGQSRSPVPLARKAR